MRCLNSVSAVTAAVTPLVSDTMNGFAVSFDAVNLTEEIQKEYYKFADAGGPDIMNFGNVLISRQFALGVRWKY
jgi:iron complex outermembrane recepter protein